MDRKYGIWILPSGQENQKLQSLINTIADEYGAIKFIPHVSIAGIRCRDEGMVNLKAKIDQLAEQIHPFDITIREYGYKDEFHRCLYLLADSKELDDVFQKTSSMFPEAAQIERNQQMPHLSVVYGEHTEDTKQTIIANHPFSKLTFEAIGLDLCLSDGPEEEWQSVYHAVFSKKLWNN